MELYLADLEENGNSRIYKIQDVMSYYLSIILMLWVCDKYCIGFFYSFLWESNPNNWYHYKLPLLE